MKNFNLLIVSALLLTLGAYGQTYTIKGMEDAFNTGEVNTITARDEIYTQGSLGRTLKGKNNPIGFMENKGQIVDQNYNPNPGVKYLFCSTNFNVQLRQTGFSYDTYTEAPELNKKPANETVGRQNTGPKDMHQQPENSTLNYHRVDIELVGCNTNAQIRVYGKSETYYNYFTAGTPKGGVSNVHLYNKVVYTSIYPNIDLEFTTRAVTDGSSVPVEYQFVVHPGGNPADIKLAYSGANKISLDNNKLVVNVNAGDFTENIPSSYLRDDLQPSKKSPVNVSYTALGNNTYGFSIPAIFSIHGSSSDLIIDPTPCLDWGTYYGGNVATYMYGVAFDASDNSYITGYTVSTGGIATAGAYQVTLTGSDDAFVAKINSTGTSLLWGTYYGGTSTTVAYGIALDASDDVYITGYTNCTTGIATAGAYQTSNDGAEDVFIAKFNPSGSALLWGTFYGGTNNDLGYAIAVDGLNRVYITGTTASNFNMVTPGSFQGTYFGPQEDFVAQFNAAGSSINWASYYGGGGTNYVYAITVDASDNTYITGYTNATSDIATTGAYQTALGGTDDVFVAKINPSGSTLLWGTYYGANGFNEVLGGSCMALDASDNVYITGYTSSTAGIATATAWQPANAGGGDAFIAKISSSGSSLLEGTYYGGISIDQGYGIALDAVGDIYITGYTQSNASITTINCYQSVYGGGIDAFVSKFNPGLTSLLWGTYYGGTAEDYGFGLALDAGNDVYVSGYTASTSKIATTGEYQVGLTGGEDAFVAKFGCNMVCTLTGANISASNNVTCHGGANGSATVTAVGGLTPYTYSWAPSGGTSSTAVNLSAATYTVTVTDANGCNATASVAITQPASGVTANISGQVNVGCNGGATGSATVTAAGGTPAYTYTWTPSGGTSATANNLTAGTYTITVTDANGCSSTAAATITQPATGVIVTIASQVNVSCFGGTGSAAANAATGGASPYNYNWTPSGGTNLTANNLTAGTYTITATDNHGCTGTANVTITQPASALAVTMASQTDVSCFGGTGSATANTATGGTSPYNYNWTPSGGTNVTANNLSAGTYTITATDNHGCTATANVTITQPTSTLTITMAGQTNISCFGGTGSATANSASGGTLPYNYDWTPSGGTNLTANGLTAGTYTITATDNHGCTATAGVTITQPVSALAVTMASQVNVSCFGGTGSATANAATGGTSPYNYDWTPSGGTNLTANGLTAGTYTITATDNHGCTATASVSITQPASLLTVSIAGQTDVNCNGGTGSATANAPTGGTAPYNYDWTPSGGTNLTAAGLSAGTYTITATDNHGCTATASVTITQPASVLAVTIASQTDVSCFGGTGSATANAATGGTSPYNYDWAPSGGTNLTAASLTAGTYTITATDNHGCTATASVTITQPASAPSITIAGQTNINCFGGNGNATANAATGGTFPYVYDWAPNGGTNLTASNLTAGTYTVTATDNHGCTATASVTITQPASALAITILGQTDIACNGGTGSVTANAATGGTSPYVYNWTPGGGTNLTASNLTAGTYTITVTDNHGCTANTNVTITQPTALTVAAGATNGSICNGSCTDINATPAGGTVPYTYTWSNGATTSTVNVCPVVTTSYTVTSTDANGCTQTASTTVTVNDLPVVTLSAAKDSTCTGVPADLLTGNPAGGTYSGIGVTGNNFDPNTAGAGTFRITYIYTNISGCTDSASTQVTVNVCAGVDEVKGLDDMIKIYPNPSSQSLHIDISSQVSGQANVILFNMLGQQVNAWQMLAGNNTLDTHALPSGVYLLQIKTSYGVTNKKLVISN